VFRFGAIEAAWRREHKSLGRGGYDLLYQTEKQFCRGCGIFGD
jgi:hypothetical protein